MSVLDMLLWALVIGLGSVAVTKCVRALPPFAGWVLELKKPWACDICMTFWTVVSLCAVAWQLLEVPWQALLLVGPAAWTVGFSVLHAVSGPTSAPPRLGGLPPLTHSMLMPVDSGEEKTHAVG